MKGRAPHSIPMSSRLQGIYNCKKIIGGHLRWLEGLKQNSRGWKNSSELFNLVQKVVAEYVTEKIVEFGKTVPALRNLSRTDLVDAILNNWPEALPGIQGQRREVLICVAAHVVRHLETSTYQKVILGASKKDLLNLRLNVPLREILVRTLSASIRADLLLIRYLAFFNSIRGYPSCDRLLGLGASSSRYYLPKNKELHTLNSLFPRDTEFISRKFLEISDSSVNWSALPGGVIFRRYLRALSAAYKEKDINNVDRCYKNVSIGFAELARSQFPILLVPPAYYEGGYERPPYHDPEFRVGISSAECSRIERNATYLQNAMGSLLKKKGYEDLFNILHVRTVRVINSIGDYGINLKSKSVGQSGKSVIVAYLSEHTKAYQEMRRGKAFSVDGIRADKRIIMSFLGSLLHEFCHLHIDGTAPYILRFGQEAAGIIQEAEAEQLSRWLILKLVDTGQLEGTRSQWAAILVEMSLLEMLDKSREGDPEYFYSSSFVLNRSFNEGVIKYHKGKRRITISDINAFCHIHEEQAKEVLALFKDEALTSTKTRNWIRNRCEPNKFLYDCLKDISKRTSIS
jgi:hypothetical protein